MPTQCTFFHRIFGTYKIHTDVKTLNNVHFIKEKIVVIEVLMF